MKNKQYMQRNTLVNPSGKFDIFSFRKVDSPNMAFWTNFKLVLIFENKHKDWFFDDEIPF